MLRKPDGQYLWEEGPDREFTVSVPGRHSSKLQACSTWVQEMLALGSQICMALCWGLAAPCIAAGAVARFANYLHVVYIVLQVPLSAGQSQTFEFKVSLRCGVWAWLLTCTVPGVPDADAR